MPNKNYNNGRAKEYRVMRQLEKEGWFCIRSAGSHSIVDIVAMKATTRMIDLSDVPVLSAVMLITLATVYNGSQRPSVRLIQCKPKGGYLTPKERKEKARLEDMLGIEIEVL